MPLLWHYFVRCGQALWSADGAQAGFRAARNDTDAASLRSAEGLHHGSGPEGRAASRTPGASRDPARAELGKLTARTT